MCFESHQEMGKLVNKNSWWLSGKEPTCNAGDVGSILGSGRSPGGGNGNPLQYSSLENPRERGPWWAAVHGVKSSPMQLSSHTHIHTNQK